MYQRRSTVIISPSATLDERIRRLHPPGAMFNCESEPMNTVVERRMRQMSSDIRTKPNWRDGLNDTDTLVDWATEAKAKELTDVEFCYVLDELKYYSSLHPLGSSVKLSAADGVWFSDSLVDAETTSKLKEYAAILEDVPSRQKDWYPDDRSRVLNLVDPSLFPLIYSRSKLCRQTSTSPQIALNPRMSGEFPGSIGKWREALSGLGYYVPPCVDRYCDYESNISCWLPSEFLVENNGAVTIESYINNLHPVKHAALYPVIASVFSKFIPLLEQVVTDLVHPRQPRVVPDSTKYYESDEPAPECNDHLDEEYREWKKRATFVHPQPEPFATPERPITTYTLCGRRLQAIVRMSNIELTPSRPIYGGKDWSVAGLGNERIIATGIFFYDVANISQRSLQLREALCSWDFIADEFDFYSVVKAYGIDSKGFSYDDMMVSQELGDVEIKDRRCLAFSNILQHKVPELKLVDKNKSGHCKMLTFYFVDPSTRIPSTAIVPPQQQDWHFKYILASEPFRSLPGLVVDGIMDKVGFPISLKEAKRLRPKVRQTTGVDEDITLEFFKPNFYFSGIE